MSVVLLRDPETGRWPLRTKVGAIASAVLALVVSLTVLSLWLAADTPTYECWTPTHLDFQNWPTTVYTSDGQQIGANGHIGLFVEGRPWCGMVGHSKGAGRPWIEDNQAPTGSRTSG